MMLCPERRMLTLKAREASQVMRTVVTATTARAMAISPLDMSLPLPSRTMSMVGVKNGT